MASVTSVDLQIHISNTSLMLTYKYFGSLTINLHAISPLQIVYLLFQAVLREKLKYAIHFCKSIDTDDYARVAMTGAGVEYNVSSESDTDDWDSIGSDEPMADCVSLYST